MKVHIHIILVSLLLLLSTQVDGQQVNFYNINKDNGLPSNNAYLVLKDRHGYLWIGTDKGVVKYNGYDFKTFDVSNGMTNDDVWSFYEDGKGRLWLFSISDNIGYIYENRYRKINVTNNNITFYPSYMRGTENGVVFISASYPEKHGNKICFERNDTIKCQALDGNYSTYFFIDENKRPIILHDNYLINIKFKHGRTYLKKKCKILDSTQAENYLLFKHKLIKSWVISYQPRENSFFILNTENYSRKLIQLGENEMFKMAASDSNNNIIITTNKNMYLYNDKFENGRSLLSHKDYFDTLAAKKVYYLNDSIWGEIITTEDNGVIIDNGINRFKRNNHIDLDNYSYVGKTRDGKWWWNATKKTLVCPQSGSIIKDVFYNVNKITPLDDEHSLIASHNDFFTINKQKQVTNLFDKIIYDKTIPPYKPYKVEIQKHVRLEWLVTDVVPISKNEYFATSRSHGLIYIRIQDDTLINHTINGRKYTALLHDSLNHLIWAYYTNHILIYDLKTKKEYVFTENHLHALGIKKIEKIIIDNKGNAFIKDINNLFLYNYDKQTLNILFRNYKMQNVSIDIDNGILAAAGKFGILFSRISNGSVTNPYLYQNIKNTSYTQIDNITIWNDSVLLKTDRGVYNVKIPENNIYKPSDTRHKYIIIYNDSTRNLKGNDTLFINQENRLLSFDLINPYGNGKLRFKYKIRGIDNNWNELNSNELYLPQLDASEYYELLVTGHDDVWQSKPIKLYLYITPYWWQTTIGQQGIWVGALFIFLLVLYAVINLTRRTVLKQQERKNLQLELKSTRQALELKSIYAQINPHFIFNTINTGLYFIKKKRTEEAYEHISAFSDLLRSYLKSSRNKFITIKEEIQNLTNYIILQQARFDDKFDFRIIVNDAEQSKHLLIPSLLLQPLVENAITHGLLNKEGKGHLKIEFITNDTGNKITCIIDDDGVGRVHSAKLYSDSQTKTESYGSELIKELINVFNTFENIHIDIMYVDKTEPETGTTVILTIKNKQHESQV